MRIAIVVELEQFGRQRLAAGMPLALVLVDANLQLSHELLPFISCGRRHPHVAFPGDPGAKFNWQFSGGAGKL
jgi:hypothetical protein